MSTRLKGKTALITGATGTVGRAIARAFAGEGAHVAVNGGDERHGGEVVDAIRAAGGRATFIAADLDGTAAASRALAAAALAVLGGRIDVLVNSAGSTQGSFDEVYAVNVKAPFFLTAALAPAMAARGSGAVINLGSSATSLGVPVGALCPSTKGAVETLTRAWAAEYGPSGVRIEAISPGAGASPHPDATEARRGRVLMHGGHSGDTGTPAAIAQAAVYLASEESGFVHGTVVDVDVDGVPVVVALKVPARRLPLLAA